MIVPVALLPPMTEEGETERLATSGLRQDYLRRQRDSLGVPGHAAHYGKQSGGQAANGLNTNTEKLK